MRGKIPKRSLAKREKLLEIAAKLFLEKGYEGVSVDEITSQVGGSKTNIYSHFGGKEGLFLAVVEHLLAVILEPLRAIRVSDLSLEQALREFARTFLGIILDRQTLALHRLIVAESVRFPQVGRVWFTAGPENAYRAVETYLETQQRAGRLKPGNPRRAAALFLDMLTFDVHHRTLLQVTPRPSQAELEKLVADAVDTFLHGYHRE
jgi:TetR/AcrR family transcriptional repressor of mexJK operon